MSFELVKAERERLLKDAKRLDEQEPFTPSTYETSGNERLPGIAAEWVLVPWFLGILFAGMYLGSQGGW